VNDSDSADSADNSTAGWHQRRATLLAFMGTRREVNGKSPRPRIARPSAIAATVVFQIHGARSYTKCLRHRSRVRCRRRDGNGETPCARVRRPIDRGRFSGGKRAPWESIVLSRRRRIPSDTVTSHTRAREDRMPDERRRRSLEGRAEESERGRGAGTGGGGRIPRKNPRHCLRRRQEALEGEKFVLRG